MTSDNLSVEALLDKMGKQLKTLLEQRQIQNPMIVGIRTGGVWLAERLAQQLAVSDPISILDISFYRDDFTQKGLNPSVQPSQLQGDTEGRHIILIDDVIMSGRTVRAALNELFDYGRPASVILVALLDLQCRELPVQADVVGSTLLLGSHQIVKLSGPEPLELTIRQRT